MRVADNGNTSPLKSGRPAFAGSVFNPARMGRLSVLAFVLLGFALRLILLDGQSIWWDEAISLQLAASGLKELLGDRIVDIHPPLYFLALKGWVLVAGASSFSARFFSTWFNTVLIAAVYAFSRRYADHRTRVVAAFFTATSALYVIYSQEIRVYALLPLAYVGLLAVVSEVRKAMPTVPWRLWFLLALVEVVGLYTHYVFAAAVMYTNLVLLVALYRNRWSVRRWLVSQALTVSLFMPWAAATLVGRATAQTQAGTPRPFAEALPPGFFARMLWTFQWSGLTDMAVGDRFAVAAAVLAALLVLGIVALILDARERATTAFLLANWLVPVALTGLLWSVRPLAHPRYTAAFSVALFVLAAHIVVQVGTRLPARTLRVCLVLVICANSALALHAWYTDPRFGKDDVRGLAAWLAARTQAGDLIIAPWRDWSLDHAYTGPATIVRPNPFDEAEVWNTLSDETGPGKDVFLITYFRGTWDRRDMLPFALESAGSLIERSTFKGLVSRHYQLDHSVAPPQGGVAGARFGPFGLETVWIEQGSPADTAIALAAHWQLRETVSERYHVGLRLQDPEGWTWARVDDWLLDRRGFPTDQWESGTESTTYHILPLPAGTPPLSYTVAIDVYTVDSTGQIRYLDLLDGAGNPAGQAYRTSSVHLAPGIGLDADPYGTRPDVTSLEPPFVPAPGLSLEAAAIDRDSVAPGQALFVALHWRATTAPLPDLRPVLALRQDDETVASVSSAPASGRYPTDRWQAGELVLDRRRLAVPATARAGPADVVLCLAERCAVLGKAQVTAEEHLFEPPPIANEVHVRFGDVAELLGYEIGPKPHNSDQPITITLYWRAFDGAPARDYVVFTHVLAADGHLIAQHDGQPVAGARPTPGWLPGEIVTDEHPMVFREAYAGPAYIEVGLYDPATLERVVTAGGDDFVVLPSQLNIDYP